MTCLGDMGQGQAGYGSALVHSIEYFGCNIMITCYHAMVQMQYKTDNEIPEYSPTHTRINHQLDLHKLGESVKSATPLSIASSSVFF